ncbi:MAG: DnaJ domain-containing protein [SAR324 cluster bacterium]|nr:DnaJ domain-containing protein [SAR324 cluster bacterium]
MSLNKYVFSWITAIGLCLLSAMSTTAETPTTFLQTVQEIKLPASASLAISYDESLIAAGLVINGKTEIYLYDRQTAKEISHFKSRGENFQFLTFAPYLQQLVLAHQNKIQIWNIDAISVSSQPVDPVSHQVFEYQGSHIARPSFNFPDKSLRWIDDLNFHELQTNTPQSRVILKSEMPASGFAYSPEQQLLAVFFPHNNRILTYAPYQSDKLAEIDYHHFPVVGAYFVRPNILLSLDSENNLVWGHVKSRIKIHQISANLKDEQALGLYPVYDDKIMVITTRNKSNEFSAYIIKKDGQILNKLALAHANALAVSPTGKYIVTVTPEQKMVVSSTVTHEDPKDYIRKLQLAGANETARRYRNHLDELPDILPIPATTLTNNQLSSLLDSLNAAEIAGQWQEAQRWVDDILVLSPQHPEAMDALQRIKEHQDQILMEQAQTAMKNADSQQAIQLFQQVPEQSKFYSEARQQIEFIEKESQIELKIQSAQKWMRSSNWTVAKNLLNDALKLAPEHPQALSLLDEVETHDQQNLAWDILTTMVALSILAGAGIFAYRSRHLWIHRFKMEPDDDEPKLKPPLHTKIKQQQATSQKPLGNPKHYEETWSKTMEFLKLAQKADIHQKYGTQFLDFEAELRIIQKKASSPNANYNQLTSQTLFILQTLRSFKFEKQQQEQKKEDPPPKMEKNSESIKPDYYEILGVPKSASADDIKKAFYKKLKEYHPDRHQSSDFEWVKQQAEQMTLQIKNAYEVLSNQETRKKYDLRRQS